MDKQSRGFGVFLLYVGAIVLIIYLAGVYR
jgi:hypothetical protein